MLRYPEQSWEIPRIIEHCSPLIRQYQPSWLMNHWLIRINHLWASINHQLTIHEPSIHQLINDGLVHKPSWTINAWILVTFTSYLGNFRPNSAPSSPPQQSRHQKDRPGSTTKLGSNPTQDRCRYQYLLITIGYTNHQPRILFVPMADIGIAAMTGR